MPFPIISTPSYPNVPLAPGVPLVPRSISFDVSIPGIDGEIELTASAGGLGSVVGQPQWGIFDQNGDPVIEADSTVTFDQRAEWRLPTYPVEQGGFQNYNKVKLPEEQRVRMAITGDRPGFLDVMETIAASTNLYVIVAKDAVYQNANVTHYDYHREAAGISRLIIDVYFWQVMQVQTQAFSNTAQPTGQGQTNGGAVQPQTPQQPGQNFGPGTPLPSGGSGAPGVQGLPGTPSGPAVQRQIGQPDGPGTEAANIG